MPLNCFLVSVFLLFLLLASNSILDLLSPFMSPSLSLNSSLVLTTASLYLYTSGGIVQLTGSHASLPYFDKMQAYS